MLIATDPGFAGTKLSLAEALSSARETRELRLGAGVLGETACVFQNHFTGQRAIIVADPRTMRLAGVTVASALAEAGIAGLEPFIFDDPGLYSETRYVEQLVAALREHDAIPVAIGSGTINDLVKLAAHRTGRSGYLLSLIHI